MGFQRKLKRSYFYMFVIPALIIVLIAATLLMVISERYEQQLENISDEAILTAAVQSVIKDFKEVRDDKHPNRVEQSYRNMTENLAESGYSLYITADGVERYNTLTEQDRVIMDKYDDSLYESEDFMTIDNGTASVIKQRFFKGDTEYVLYAVNTDYNADALVLIESIKKGILLFSLLIIFVMIFLIFVTNRFLSQRMSKMILTPLELLSNSAKQIRDGNLDISVAYDSNDEFADVCADFDDMRKRLKTSVEEELASEENRRELFAGISHDLRSPLTSVKGMPKDCWTALQPRTKSAANTMLPSIKRPAKWMRWLISCFCSPSWIPTNTRSIFRWLRFPIIWIRLSTCLKMTIKKTALR